MLTKREGGRHTRFFPSYRSQLYFRTTNMTGTVELREGMEMVMPGDNAELKIVPGKRIAMEEKSRFATTR